MEKTLKQLISEMDNIEGNNRVDEVVAGLGIVGMLDGFTKNPSVKGGRGGTNPTQIDSKKAELAAIEKRMNQHSQSQPSSTEEYVAWSKKGLDLIDKHLQVLQDIQFMIQKTLNNGKRVSAQTARQQGQFIQDLDRQINDQ